MHKILGLSNGIKYAVIASLAFEGRKFMYVVSLTDNPEFLYLERAIDKSVNIVEDPELLLKLAQISTIEAVKLANNVDPIPHK